MRKHILFTSIRIDRMWEYLFGLFAAITAGMHVFGMRMFFVYKDRFYEVFAFVVATMIVSRLLIYYAMEHTTNPTLIHLILNCSVFVTFFLSIAVLGLKDFHIGFFLLGVLLTVIGLGFVQYSYQLKK